MTKIKLPRTYTNPHSNPNYEKYVGMPVVSYSQLTSFKHELYGNEWYRTYLFGLPRTSSIWASIGSEVGEFFENLGQVEWDQQEWISKEDDYDFLSSLLYGPECSYEYEVIFPIDIEGQIILFRGYIDVLQPSGDKVDIIDIKTGGEKKIKDYGGADYWQTRLYSYGMEYLGFDIGYVGVKLIHRKGNNTDKYPIRFPGEYWDIPTPYNKKAVEEYIDKKIIPQIKGISDMYKSYLKMFGE